MEKKSILKKACCGKGGPVSDAAKKGFKDAYTSNMAKYRNESGIDKNMFPDSIRSGMKGVIYGGLKGGEAIVSKAKDKVKKVIKDRIQEQKNWENRKNNENYYGSAKNFKNK